jgi:hypothetical protein
LGVHGWVHEIFSTASHLTKISQFQSISIATERRHDGLSHSPNITEQFSMHYSWGKATGTSLIAKKTHCMRTSPFSRTMDGAKQQQHNKIRTSKITADGPDHRQCYSRHVTDSRDRQPQASEVSCLVTDMELEEMLEHRSV